MHTHIKLYSNKIHAYIHQTVFHSRAHPQRMLQPEQTCPLGTIYFSSALVEFNLSGVSDSLQPHGLQHARPHCPGVYSLMSIESMLPSKRAKREAKKKK